MSSPYHISDMQKTCVAAGTNLSSLAVRPSSGQNYQDNDGIWLPQHVVPSHNPLNTIGGRIISSRCYYNIELRYIPIILTCDSIPSASRGPPPLPPHIIRSPNDNEKPDSGHQHTDIMHAYLHGRKANQNAIMGSTGDVITVARARSQRPSEREMTI